MSSDTTRTREGRKLRVTAICGAVLMLAACTRTSSRDRFPATEATLEIVDTFPREGDVGVDPTAVLQLCLSGYLDPRTVDVNTMRLGSGEFPPDTQTTLEFFPTHPRGDLSTIADERWCPGSVLSLRALIVPSPVLHRMWIAPSVVGWGGEQLDTETPGWTTPDDPEDDPVFIVEFGYGSADEADTGSDTGDVPSEPVLPVPTLTDLFAPGAVFDVENPACSCHREPDTVAIDLLDLRSPGRAFSDLVNDTSLQSTGFPMVSPRSPAESYLLHVLLRNPDGSGLAGIR
ncbi:MAG: hypothetical protein ACPG77_12805, partial [Nannocystaceae bacterium]